jgi:hypothetical protein
MSGNSRVMQREDARAKAQDSYLIRESRRQDILSTAI